MKKFLDTCRRLLSIALNLFVLCAEPIALPLSWEMGQAQIFTFYTEDSNIFAAVVCAMVAVCQLWCIFTGGELPRWLKRLKFMAASCLLLTFLTVVFVLAPMNGEGGLYMLLCTSSMLYTTTCSTPWRRSSPTCCWSGNPTCRAAMCAGRCCPRWHMRRSSCR